MICTYANLEDALALQRTCRYMRTIRAEYICALEPIATARALERLQAHLCTFGNGIYTSLRKVAHQFGGVIASDFPLMHLLNEVWPLAKIEVYIPKLNSSTIGDLETAIASDFQSIKLAPNNAVLNCLKSTHTHAYVIYAQCKTALIDNQCSSPLALNIEFICTDNTDPISYITENFNFSFCQVYTDLQSLHCMSFWQQMNKVGYFTNLHNIEEKNTLNCIGRLAKLYEAQHGFNILLNEQ